MKILIEGEKYKLDLIQKVFDDPKFYHQEGDDATILSVGYYHSFNRGELVYMLPKVFMRDKENTVFGITKQQLFNVEKNDSFKHKSEYNWIRQTTVYFYNSLLEFRRRNSSSSIVQSSLSVNLNSNLNDQEYSYLDLLLTFVNFYKKNRDLILFKSIEYKSNQLKNPKWDKTIQKSTPLINQRNHPVYDTYKNKKRIIDSEEELMTYFLSIINHFNEQHNLYLSINKSYSLIKGSKFKLLQKTGSKKIRKIKYRYFNDTMRKIYRLCEIYFSKTDTAGINKKTEEFISVNNYNIVFEDMVDKLFSDSIVEKKTSSGTTLKHLKYNDDGKILDHIFDYQSLVDTSNIFYIGDSKYYKSDNSAGKVSKYKQFTYAKNIIQYNIDFFNDSGESEYYLPNIRYRDELTEGYNITPNFFIYGYIDEYKNFTESLLVPKGEIVKSFHFEDRLFDRDTLFVHQYKINFLYVLKNYSQASSDKITEFRQSTKALFRRNFIDFFNSESKFSFYRLKIGNTESFVEKNFRSLLGKCYVITNGSLIIAIHHGDESLNHLLSDLEKTELFNEEKTPN